MPDGKKNVALIANGDITCYSAAKERLAGTDYFIAVDGGLRHFRNLEVIPNVMLGDFDSAYPHVVERYNEQGVLTLPFPEEKDATDLALAAAYTLTMNPASIIILGALGGRLDHTLANLHVLGHINTQNGDIQAEIWDRDTVVNLVHPYSCCEIFFSFPRKAYKNLSLYPLGNRATGVTTRGLKYPLTNETLHAGETRGTSNIFDADTAEISVESGLLLVIRSKPPQDPDEWTDEHGPIRPI